MTPPNPPNSSSDSFPAWREAPKTRAWEDKLRAEGWQLDSLRALNALNRSDGSLLFALVEAKGKDPEGKPMLPYALLRGGACVIVPVCRNRATGEGRFLMIRQRRVGSGAWSLEFPAGMLDETPDDPIGTAVRELEEETGLRVEASALIPLWDHALYSSPGLSDESIYFYGAEIFLEDEAFRALEGGAAGHPDEGEHITTTLKTFAEAAPEISSLQPLLGFMLYTRRFGAIS